jgi:hypothetical protein
MLGTVVKMLETVVKMLETVVKMLASIFQNRELSRSSMMANSARFNI